MEYIVVLHPRRKGPFRRTIDGQRFEFHANQSVKLTGKQLIQVVSDLGSALVLIDEVKEKRENQEVVSFVPNWLATKIMAIQAAERKIELAEENGTNPGEAMTPFERDCWERRDEIAEERSREAEKPDVLDELAEFLDMSVEAIDFLAANGMPVGATKFDTGAVTEWLKSKDGAPFAIEARKMSAKPSEEGGQRESDMDPDDEHEEIGPVELSSQSKVAAHFDVTVDEVKAWIKDGLKKEGKVYKSDVVYQWLKENQKLGDDVSDNFANQMDLDIFFTSTGEGDELVQEFKVFTSFGELVNDQRLTEPSDVTGLLVEITSDLPEEEIGTVTE